MVRMAFSKPAHATKAGTNNGPSKPSLKLPGDYKLALNPGFLFQNLSHSFGEKSEGKPEGISDMIWWLNI